MIDDRRNNEYENYDNHTFGMDDFSEYNRVHRG